MVRLAAFAKKIGISRQYILRLIREGKLSATRKGKIYYLDPDKAKAELEEYRDPSKSPQRQWAREQKGKGARIAKQDRDRTDENQDAGEQSVDDETNYGGLSRRLTATRIAREIVNAKKAELDLRQREGNLISVEDVIATNRIIDNVIRQKMISLSNRAAPKLINQASIPKVKEILDDVINDILTELYEMRKNEDVNEVEN